MRKLLFILSLFIGLFSTAQVRQQINAYGYDWNRGGFIHSLDIPHDTITLALKDSASIAIKNGILYRWNGYNWSTLLGSGGSGTNLFNSDGTLTGNRSVNLGSNQILFSGSGTGSLLLSTGNTAKLITPYAGISAINRNAYLFAQDSIYLNGYSGGQTNFNAVSSDTTKYKPLGINATTGALARMDSWQGGGGGTSGAIVDADTASNIAILGGHLKATYSGGTSTWAWINDSQHEKLNVTDVIARSGFVTVKFKNHYNKIINFIVGNDETTSITANSTSGTPFYANGPYLSGARIYNDSADIYINKQYSSAILVYWNGSAWSLSQQTFFNGLLNPNSPAISISNTGSGIRLTNIPLNMRSVPIIIPYTPNFAAQNAQYSIGVEAITRNWLDITVVENSTGNRITSFPSGFGFFIDFGPMWFNINPTTEDFGISNNFEIISIMKKY